MTGGQGFMNDGGRQWRPAPSGLALARGWAHVVRGRLDVAAEAEAEASATLSPDERERAARFRFEHLRRRFVVARGVLRLLLGRVLGRDPARLVFEYGETGKPALARGSAGSDVRFNVSHSEDAALWAFSLGLDVGVDIERQEPMEDAERVAQRVFSERERAVLRAHAEPERTACFARCWTRKEALIKATGEGVLDDLPSIDVTLDRSEPPRVLSLRGDAAEAARWSLFDLDPFPGFAGALAARSRRLRLRCWDWPGG